MNRNIYIFTESFPYGKGEAFLVNELNYLVNNFERVFIIPLQADNQSRETPTNVEVLQPLLKFDTKKKKLKLIIKGLFCFSPYRFAFKEWKIKKPYKNKKRIWLFFTSLLRFRTIYQSININPQKNDILYFYWGDKSVLLAPELKKRYGSDIVVRFHGSDLYEETKHGYIPFREYFFPAIDKFIFISENGRKYLLQTYPLLVDKGRAFVSRLGVKDNGFNKKQISEPAPFHIVSCSNLVEIKRIDLIIGALKLITFNLKWTHIGDGPLRVSLQAECHSLPDNIKVVWEGQKTNEEVIRFYQENYVDLFINVSSSEGIPVSIMEAISFGIPVMATNVGGVSEIVNNSNGVLLPANIDIKLLAENIYNFIQNKNGTLRKKAREQWKQNFNADKNYHEFIRILKNKP